jgi:hypothetical protein
MTAQAMPDRATDARDEILWRDRTGRANEPQQFAQETFR